MSGEDDDSMAANNSLIDPKGLITAVIIGALSAFAASYILSDRTATKLEAAQKEQQEFRIEVREYMRGRNTEILALHDRMARLETSINARTYEIQRGIDSMSGISGQAGMPSNTLRK